MRVMGLEEMRRHRLTLRQSVEFFAYRESQVGKSGVGGSPGMRGRAMMYVCTGSV